MIMEVRDIAIDKVDSEKYNVRRHSYFRCIVPSRAYTCTCTHNTQTIHTNMDWRQAMLAFRIDRKGLTYIRTNMHAYMHNSSMDAWATYVVLTKNVRFRSTTSFYAV